MNRRNWIFRISGLMAASALPFGSAGAAANFPLTKTRDEWRKLLPPDAYRVLFEEGTERAGSSPLNDEKRDGTFICAACSPAAVRQRPQVRERHRLAQFLAADRRRPRHLDRLQADLSAHRVSLLALRRASGACVQ